MKTSQWAHFSVLLISSVLHFSGVTQLIQLDTGADGICRVSIYIFRHISKTYTFFYHNLIVMSSFKLFFYYSIICVVGFRIVHSWGQQQIRVSFTDFRKYRVFCWALMFRDHTSCLFLTLKFNLEKKKKQKSLKFRRFNTK